MINSKKEALEYLYEKKFYSGSYGELEAVFSKDIIDQIITLGYIKITVDIAGIKRWEVKEYCKKRILPKYEKPKDFFDSFFS